MGWSRPVTQTLRRLRQGDHEFQGALIASCDLVSKNLSQPNQKINLGTQGLVCHLGNREVAGSCLTECPERWEVWNVKEGGMGLEGQ